MLDKKFKYPGDEAFYGLVLKKDYDWDTSKRRVLIVMQSVDTLDMKNNEIASRPALINAVKYARGIARKYKPELPNFAFACINHQNRKHLHLHGQAKAEAEAEFKERTSKLIAVLNPTHILFSGDLNLLYPVDHSNEKNGWVHAIGGRKVTSTLDFSRLMEKNGELANLLGFWCHHLANLLVGKLPHSLANLPLKPVYVNTMEQIDEIVEKWGTANLVGVDTETRNLSVLRNGIYTIQLCMDTDPSVGYVIPIDHPHETNPWSLDQRKEIKRKLQKCFGAKTGPELVTFNGIFDLRVIRKALKLDIIYLTVWEIMAGEHLLDENVASMSGLGIRAGGLAAVFTSYGNDFYYDTTTLFSKSERSTTGSVSPSDPDFLKYAAMDAISIIAIRGVQIERASYQDFHKDYGPYFIRHMRHQMSDTTHQLSHLKESGSLIDKRYLANLLTSDSVLVKAIKELNDEFKTYPEVRQANDALLAESGFKAGSLFGSAKQWVFSFTKPAHKLKLFIEVCKLKAVSQTSTGQDAIDKEFINHYKDRNFLVAKFGEFQGATKLFSTYIKGWYKQITREVDGATDSHLRADYTFYDVETGRLASRKPSLQNIPARGKLSKIIKEAFVTLDGHLQIRFDYSAHEVRVWSIVSLDQVLASAFKEGQSLRQRLIKTPTDEIRIELKTKGDLHISNVKRFFDKWVEKSDPLREAIKKVIFGVIYGKSAETLSDDIKQTEIEELKAKMGEAYKAKSPELKSLERKFYKLLEEDRSEYAQGIVDKLFSEFKRGHQWILRMQRMATEKFYVFSPIGRIRHLYAAMTGDKQIISRQVRRGMNAPIQGFASEIAVKASRLMQTSYYSEQKSIKNMLGLTGRYPIKFNRIVHDALYWTVPFEMVIPFIHIMQWEATYGVAQSYEREFGLKLTVEPEIELEVGVKDTSSFKWDWSLPQLKQHIEASVDIGIKDKIFTRTKEDILDSIYAPWRDPSTLAYLDSKYPLLNVSLIEEIKNVVNQPA